MTKFLEYVVENAKDEKTLIGELLYDLKTAFPNIETIVNKIVIIRLKKI